MSTIDSSQRSKYLSFLLRHRPEASGLTLDKEGWCSIPDLLAKTNFTLQELESIVSQDKKGRYSFRYWEMADAGIPHTREPIAIRANQGHSTESVKMSFKKAVPPVVLYHGTSKDAWEAIEKQGLKPMKRHHVHLSADIETAESVAGRRKVTTIVLKVDARAMLAAGYNFYLSDNGVWLIDSVPPNFISKFK